MQIPDLVNGTFEAIGAISAWSNFQRLRKDREVKGVVWQFTIFWVTWGIWNIYYYPILGQWISTVSGVVLCAGNFAWLGLLTKIKLNARNREQRISTNR